MTKYVEDTIAAIDLKITFLQSLRKNLESFFKDWTIEVDAEPAAKAPARKAKVPHANNGQRARRAMPPAAQRILAVASTLAEPMQITAFANAAGIPKSSAKSSFDRWMGRGWIKKVGYGQYARSRTFPHPAAPPLAERAALPARTHGPLATHILTEAGRVDLEKKLEGALKQRDAARAAGREAIEDIFQKEIDKLEEQLRK